MSAAAGALPLRATEPPGSRAASNASVSGIGGSAASGCDGSSEGGAIELEDGAASDELDIACSAELGTEEEEALEAGGADDGAATSDDEADASEEDAAMGSVDEEAVLASAEDDDDDEGGSSGAMLVMSEAGGASLDELLTTGATDEEAMLDDEAGGVYPVRVTFQVPPAGLAPEMAATAASPSAWVATLPVSDHLLPSNIARPLVRWPRASRPAVTFSAKPAGSPEAIAVVSPLTFAARRVASVFTVSLGT